MYTYSPLRLPSQNRTLALLISTVQSPSKSPPTKKSRSGEHTVGCCICGPKSMCPTKKCSCLRNGLSCIAYKSECCMNITKIVPTSSEIRDIVLTNFKGRKAKDSIPEINSRKCSLIPFRLSSLKAILPNQGQIPSLLYRYRKMRVGIRAS